MNSRLVIGVSIDADAGEIHSALVRVSGMGFDSQLVSVAAACVPTFRLAGSVSEPRATFDAAMTPGGHLDPRVIADQIMEGVSSLVERAGLPLDEVLLMSVLAGVWPAHPYEALIAARLAELSGVTVVSSLSCRDWAAGGRGGPIGALVDWLVANNQRFTRIVLHVNEASRLTILPAAGGPSRVRSFEAGPGMRLLDALAAAFSQGRSAVDSRGMLAVQGRQIKPLVRRWATHPFLRQPPPKSLSALEFAAPFVDETMQLAIERGWSVADVLCTATHFIAACPADALRQFVLKDQNVEQVAVVGRGTLNGFLLRLLEEQFTDTGITTITLPDIARDAYEAVTAAVLGCLMLDGVPSSLPAITGASGPRLLGDLIPGSSRSWRQCVEWMQHASKLVSPRAA